MRLRASLGIVAGSATFVISSTALSLPSGEPLKPGEPLASLVKELPQCEDISPDELWAVTSSQVKECLRLPNCVGGYCAALGIGVRNGESCVIVRNGGAKQIVVRVSLNLDRPKPEWKNYDRVIAPGETMRLIETGKKPSDETCLTEWPHQIVTPKLPKPPAVASAPPISFDPVGSLSAPSTSSQTTSVIPSPRTAQISKPAPVTPRVHITSGEACNKPDPGSWLGGHKFVQGNQYFLVNQGSQAVKVVVNFSWRHWNDPKKSGQFAKPHTVQPGQRTLLGCSKSGMIGDYMDNSWSIVSETIL